MFDEGHTGISLLFLFCIFFIPSIYRRGGVLLMITQSLRRFFQTKTSSKGVEVARRCSEWPNSALYSTHWAYSNPQEAAKPGKLWRNFRCRVSNARCQSILPSPLPDLASGSGQLKKAPSLLVCCRLLVCLDELKITIVAPIQDSDATTVVIHVHNSDLESTTHWGIELPYWRCHNGHSLPI